MVKVPQKAAFDEAAMYGKLIGALKVLYIGFTILGIVLNLYVKNNIVDDVVTAVLIFSVVALFFLELIQRDKYYCAESLRRNALIDNSFQTKFSNTSVEGYYDSDDVKSGLERNLSNIHESSFFTQHIANDMETRNILLVILVVLILVVGMTLCDFQQKILLVMVQVFFTAGVLNKLCYIHKLKVSCAEVCDNCKKIWSDYTKQEGRKGSKFTALVIREIIRYETALSYSGIMLSEGIYNKNKEALTNEWLDIKKWYDI